MSSLLFPLRVHRPTLDFLTDAEVLERIQSATIDTNFIFAVDSGELVVVEGQSLRRIQGILKEETVPLPEGALYPPESILLGKAIHRDSVDLVGENGRLWRFEGVEVLVSVNGVPGPLSMQVTV